MHLTDRGLRLSASDLSHFLSCRHLTALDLAALRKTRDRPYRSEDPLLELLRKRGMEHEQAYVELLAREGRQVVDLNGISRKETDKAITATLDAIRGGADVIVQAALQHETWFGYADVLVRRDVESQLGAWSYEVIDTKLARETRAGTVLQLGLYSAMLAEIQGTKPEHFHVVIPGLGGAQPISIPFRMDDYAAYMRLMQRELLRSTGMDPAELASLYYPDPVDHCSVCDWRRSCNEKRHADDHLSLVAGIGRLHRRELAANGFTTLAAYAGMAVPMPFKPGRGSKESFARYQQQALVQLQSRTNGALAFNLRPPEPPPTDPTRPVEPRGLCRLPEPSSGDVFLDLEGDAYADEGGREYLFGLVTFDNGTVEYRKWWAFTAAEERVAFEQVMDFIMVRLASDPNMHIYHFAPYEPSAFKRLMGRHATREQALDKLLRGGRFIDLLQVVRQSMWAGVESYSIKQLEPLYKFTRDVNLPDANYSLRRMEYALQVKQPALALDEDREIIVGYNRDDCVSTLRLRDWLERVRSDAESKGRSFPRPPFEPDVPPERVTERDLAVRALRAELLADVPDENRTSEQQATWLLSYLLDFHRREDKATWWEYFRLRGLSEEELLDEREAVAGLEFVERVDAGGFYKNGKPKGPVVDRYRYPEQEMEIDRGASLRTATEGQSFAKVADVDRVTRTIDIEKGRSKAEIHPRALFKFEYVPVEEMQDSLSNLGRQVADSGLIRTGPSAAVDLLLRNPPRLRNGAFKRAPDESEVQFAVRVVRNLDRSILAIQGPPGAGKTYTGSQMIAALVADGLTVGVTANSHKVIRKLLDGAREAAANGKVSLRAGHKGGENRPDAPPEEVRYLDTNEAAFEALQSGIVNVLGGTAWMWAREEFANTIDVLFVDEAGQMSLANVLAVAQSAKSIVLLGDPQQLDQPTQGSHPDGVAVSALQRILGTDKTIPEDRGIFLPLTWRMAPALCGFSSEMYYESRLHSKPGLERQALQNAGELSGSGLRFIDVDHDGNRNHSPEEVEIVAQLVERLTSGGVTWMDENGIARSIGLDEILVVAPYNTHVNRLVERLPGARVGTVDKFQGQEAPVVIYSMATSRPEDAPRGLEFLYSPNRLNVATSRARCAAILVASPHLYQPECRTVRQIKLANGLCRFREMAKPLTLF